MLSSYPQAVLLLSWAAFAFSVVACALAYRKTDLGPIKRQLGELKLQLNLLESESSQLQAAWKRTNARIAMQQARARAAAGDQDEETPDPQRDPEGWRAAIRDRFLVKRN